MEDDGVDIGVLIFEFVCGPQVEGLAAVLLHPSCISLSKNFVREESQQREHVGEMCCW